MDRDKGLSKIRRAELLARLTLLEQMISEQSERVKHIRQRGWDATLADERLALLEDSHKLYRSALGHLLGKGFDESGVDGESADPSATDPESPRR
jgi:hypothetical protein